MVVSPSKNRCCSLLRFKVILTFYHQTIYSECSPKSFCLTKISFHESLIKKCEGEQQRGFGWAGFYIPRDVTMA